MDGKFPWKLHFVASWGWFYAYGRMVRVAFMFLGYKGTNSLTIELYNTYYEKKDDKNHS